MMEKTYLDPDGGQFFDLISTYLGLEARHEVRQAFELARREHEGKSRYSGEPFFTHPLTIAYYLAEYQLDASALVAALLHDVVEDTRVSVEEIQQQFGSEVGRLVDGLTKFKAVADSRPLSKEEVQEATLHKLFGFMADDVRVGIIKLFDRLHNMRTISATSPASQQRKAEETLAVYAPLANRLGMWDLKNELERRSLEVLDQKAYNQISQRLEQVWHQHQPAFATVSPEIAEKLTQSGITVVDIFISPENEYSVYRSSVSGNGQGRRFKVDETLRLVVVLKDEPSCYLALGELHQMWRPVSGTFDDYIAAPRDNLYRSLHTTLVHPSGSRIKIRLRSVAMNVLSEIGVLSRWVHIGMGMPLWSNEIGRRVDTLIESISDKINLEPHDPRVGVQGVMQDVFRDQIVVYTPKGDIKELPQGATPLDFAYTIHSEVGDQCRGAVVNGQPAALNQPLHDGDRVQIVKRGDGPQRIWLDEDLGYLKTNGAQTRVRRWFRRLPPEVALKEGQRLLEKELARLGLSGSSHKKVAEWLGFDRADLLYYALGKAEILPTVVATRILKETWDQGPCREVGAVVRTDEGESFLISNASRRSLHLCRVCHPRPDDRIVGFSRNNKKVTVHKEGCRVLPVDPLADHTLKLRWIDEDSCLVRLFTVRIDVYDRSGLLFEVTRLLQDESVNIPQVYAHTNGGEGFVLLEMEVVSPRQMVRILHRIHTLVNVHSITCLSQEEVELSGFLRDDL